MRSAASVASWVYLRRCSRSSHSPGQGWRCACSAKSQRPDWQRLREADAIVVDEIRNAGLYETTWQAFAVLLPVQTVGVMGDERSYGDTVAVRSGRLRRRHDGGTGAACHA